MKKIMSIIVFILISSFILVSCSGGKGSAHEQGEYETLFDHSEIDWYLTQKYGNDAPSQYYYYEYNDGEESFLIAMKVTDTDLPECVLHAFNSGIHDWYLYDNNLIESSGSEIIGTTEDGQDIKSIEFMLNDFTFFIISTCDKNGRINRLMFIYDLNGSGDYQEYTYDSKGRVESFISRNLSYYDAFFAEPDPEVYYRTVTYSYDDNNRLTTLTSIENGNDEWKEQWFITYDENGQRSSIDSFFGENHESTLDLARDENGRVIQGTSIRYYEDGSEPYERIVNINYLPGGESYYDNDWVPN